MFEPEPPRELKPLEAHRVVLRRLEERDVESFLAYRNDPAVWTFEDRSEIGEELARRFIDHQKDRSIGVPGEWLQIGIELRETGRMIGDLGFCVDREYPHTAELGYRLQSAYWGRGLATEAVGRLLDFAFGTLHLHRIIAYTNCRNTSSVALLERLGFRREGRLVESFLLRGHWVDEYLYALLSTEWTARTT